MTTTKDQRLAAARLYFGVDPAYLSNNDGVGKWIDDGVETDDHTGIDDGVCRVARLLAERETALTEQVAALTEQVERLRKLFLDVGGDGHNVLALVDLWQSEVMTVRADVARLTKERDDLDAKAGRLSTSEASATAAFRESTAIHVIERFADRVRLAAMTADNARHVKTIATLVDALETARPSVEALTTVDEPDDDDVDALEVIDAALAAAKL